MKKGHLLAKKDSPAIKLFFLNLNERKNLNLSRVKNNMEFKDFGLNIRTFPDIKKKEGGGGSRNSRTTPSSVLKCLKSISSSYNLELTLNINSFSEP